MTQFRLRRAATTAAVLLLAAICTAQTAPTAQPTASDQTSNAQLQSGQPQLEQRYPRYLIQRSDVLLLTFPLTPEFNQTVTVQPDGYVNLQNAGSLHVQGLSVPQMIDAVRSAYGHVLHDPVISVDLKEFQKPFFTVSGQVGKPGQYDLGSDITVAEALAIAGGMTMPTAKTQIFLFHRTSDSWYQVEKVNLNDVLHGKSATEDAVLKSGDMIYVPEKFIAKFRKYVPYSIGAIAGTYLEQ